MGKLCEWPTCDVPAMFVIDLMYLGIVRACSLHEESFVKLNEKILKQHRKNDPKN